MALAKTIPAGPAAASRPQDDVGCMYFPTLRTAVACFLQGGCILSIDPVDLAVRSLRVSKSVAYPATTFWTEVKCEKPSEVGDWSPTCVWEVPSETGGWRATVFPACGLTRHDTHLEVAFWGLSSSSLVSCAWSKVIYMCRENADVLAPLFDLPPSRWSAVTPQTEVGTFRFLVACHSGIHVVTLSNVNHTISLEGIVREPVRPDGEVSAADQRRLEAAVSCWDALLSIEGFSCQLVPPTRKPPPPLPQFEHNALGSSAPAPAYRRATSKASAPSLTLVVSGGWCNTTDSPNDAVFLVTSDQELITRHDQSGMPEVPTIRVLGGPLGLELPLGETDLGLTYSMEAKSFRHGIQPPGPVSQFQGARSLHLSLSSSDSEADESGQVGRPNPFDVTEFLSNGSPHRGQVTRKETAHSKMRSPSYASATKASAIRQGTAEPSSVGRHSATKSLRKPEGFVPPTLTLAAVEVCRCAPTSNSGFAPYLFKYDPSRESLMWIGADSTYTLRLDKARSVWELLKVSGKTVATGLPPAVTTEVDSPLAVTSPDGKLHVIVHRFQDVVEEEKPRNAPDLYQVPISRLYVLMSGDAPAKRKDVAVWRAPSRARSPPRRRTHLPLLADERGAHKEILSPRKRVEDIATRSLLHVKGDSYTDLGRLIRSLESNPTVLDVSGLPSPISSADLYTIAHLTRQSKQTRTFNISFQEFGVVETKLLLRNIAECPHLSTILFNRTRFSPAETNSEIHQWLKELVDERTQRETQQAEDEEVRIRERRTRQARKRAIGQARLRIEHADQRSLLEVRAARAVHTLYWEEAIAIAALFAEYQLYTFFLRSNAQKSAVERTALMEIEVVDVATTLSEEEARSWRRLTALHESKIVELVYRQQRQEEARQRHLQEVERRNAKRQEQRIREIARSCMQVLDVEERPARNRVQDTRDADLADMQLAYRGFMRMHHTFIVIQRTFNDTVIVLEHHYKQACDASARLWKAAQKAAIATLEQEIHDLGRGREQEVEKQRILKAALLDASRREVVRWLRSERLKSRLEVRGTPPKIFLDQPAKELIVTEDSMFSQPLPVASGISVVPVLPFYMKNRSLVEMEEDEVRTETWIHLKSAIHRLRITASIRRRGSNGRTYAGSSVAVAAFSGHVPVDTLNAITQSQLDMEDDWGFYAGRDSDDGRAKPPPTFNPPQSIPCFVPASTRLQMQGHPFTEEGAVIVDSVSKRELGTYVITPLEEHVVTLHTECTEENIRAVLQCFSLVAGPDPDDRRESVSGALFRERLYEVSYRVEGLFAVPTEATDFSSLPTPLGMTPTTMLPSSHALPEDWTVVPRDPTSVTSPTTYAVSTVTHNVTLHVIPPILELPARSPFNYVEQSGPQSYCKGVSFTASCNNYVIPFLPKAILTAQMSPRIDPFDAFQFGGGLVLEERPVWQIERSALPAIQPVAGSMRSMKPAPPSTHPCMPSRLVITYQGEVLATVLEPGPLRTESAASQLASLRSHSFLKQSMIATPRPPSQDKVGTKSPKTGRNRSNTRVNAKNKDDELLAEQQEVERQEQVEKQRRRRRQVQHQIIMQTSQNPASTPVMVLQLSDTANGDQLLQLVKNLQFVNDSCMPVEEQRRIVVGLSLLTPVSLTSGELLTWAPGTAPGNVGTGAVAVSLASGTAEGKIKGLEVHSFSSCGLQVEARDNPSSIDLCFDTVGYRLPHPLHASHLVYCAGSRSTDVYFASAAVVMDADTTEFSGGFMNIAIVEGFKRDRDALDFKPQGTRAFASTSDLNLSVSSPIGVDEEHILGRKLSLEGQCVLFDGEVVAILDRQGGGRRDGRRRDEGPLMVGSTLPLQSIPAGGKLTFYFIQRDDTAATDDSVDPAVPRGFRPLHCTLDIVQEIIRCVTFSTRSSASNPFTAVTEHRTIVCEFAHGDTKPVHARCNLKVTAPLVSIASKDSFITHRENSGPCMIGKDFSVAKDDDGWDSGFILLECVRGFNPATDTLGISAGPDLPMTEIPKRNISKSSSPHIDEPPAEKHESRLRSQTRQLHLRKAASLALLQSRMLGLAIRGSPSQPQPAPIREYELRYPGGASPLAHVTVQGPTLKVAFGSDCQQPIRAKDVTTILRRLTYESTDNNPLDLTRIFKVTANDGRPQSTCATVQMEILTIDDATEITRPDADPDQPVHFRALGEDDSLGFALLSDVVVSDPDTFTFNEAVVSVECVGGSERTDTLYILSEEQQIAHERNRRYQGRVTQYKEWVLERQQRDLQEAANRTAAALEVSMVRMASMKRAPKRSHPQEDSAAPSPSRVADSELPIPRLEDPENDVDRHEFASEIVTVCDVETSAGAKQVVYLGRCPLGTLTYKKSVPTLFLTLGALPEGDEVPTTHEGALRTFQRWGSDPSANPSANPNEVPSTYPFIPITAVQRFFRTVGFKSMHSNLHKLKGGHRVFEVKVAVGKVVGKLRHTVNAQPPLIAQLSAPTAPQVTYVEGCNPVRLFPHLQLVAADLGNLMREGTVVVGILEDPTVPRQSTEAHPTAGRAPSFVKGRDLFTNPSLFVEESDSIEFLTEEQYAPYSREAVISNRRESLQDTRMKRGASRKPATKPAPSPVGVDVAAFSVVDGNQLFYRKDYMGTFFVNRAHYFVRQSSPSMRKVSVATRMQLGSPSAIEEDSNPRVSPEPSECISSVGLKLDGASKATLAHIEGFIKRVGYRSKSSNPSTHLRTGFVDINLGPGWEGKGAVPLQVIADDDPTEIEPRSTTVQCCVDCGPLPVLAGVRVTDPDTPVFYAPSYVKFSVAETGSNDAVLRGVASGRGGANTTTILSNPLHGGEWLYLSCLKGDAALIAPDFCENCDGPFENSFKEGDVFEEAREIAERESGFDIFSDMLEALFEKGSGASTEGRRLVARLVRYGPVNIVIKLLDCRIDELQLLVGLITYNAFTPPPTPNQPLSNTACPVANTSRTLSISVRSGTAPTFRTAVTLQVLAPLLTPYPLKVTRALLPLRQGRASIVAVEAADSPICAAEVDLPLCSGRPVPILASLSVGRGLFPHGCLFTVSLSPPPPPEAMERIEHNSRRVCRTAATLAAKATQENGRRTLLLRPAHDVELKTTGGRMAVAGGEGWLLSRAPKECTLIVNREIAGHLSVLSHSCIAGSIYPMGWEEAVAFEDQEAPPEVDAPGGTIDAGDVLEKVLRRVFFASDELTQNEVITCVYVTVVNLVDGVHGTYTFGVRESSESKEEPY